MPEPERMVAAALRYQPGSDDAPRVIAKGRGYVAAQIVEAAQAAGVPLHHDPALLEVLSVVEIEALVPSEVWVAVAEVLAWAYRQDHASARGAAPA